MKYFSRISRKTPRGKWFLWIFFGLVLVFVSIFFKTRPFHWNNNYGINVATFNKDGNVIVIRFDPKREKITTIQIPKETEVSVSRNLGTWRIGSVWKLGESEKIGGLLLSETVTKVFGIPVSTWAGEKILLLTDKNYFSLIGNFLSFYKTNLTFGDKIHLTLFSLGVKNSNKITFDLKESGYLIKSRLNDGEEGYKVSGSLPIFLASAFVDPLVAINSPVVRLIDEGEKRGEAESITVTLETLGYKVAAIDMRKPSDYDCIVSGKNKESVKEISHIYSCKTGEKLESSEFDLEMKIGKEFSRRF